MLKCLEFDQGFESQTFQFNFESLKQFNLPKTIKPIFWKIWGEGQSYTVWVRLEKALGKWTLEQKNLKKTL